MHLVITLVGLAYLVDGWMIGSSSVRGAIYSTLVVVFWCGWYNVAKFILHLRSIIRLKYRSRIASAASDYLFQGSSILAIVVYLACDTIGSCIISRNFSESICGQNARGNCIVGWQALLGWVITIMYMDIGKTTQKFNGQLDVHFLFV
jgi:hypothetical protein